MDPAASPRPTLDRCASCGQQSGAPERCPSCGASLLVDVLLDRPAADAREAYAAARAAAALGHEFAAVRAAVLARPPAPVAVSLRRDRARALVAALDEAGFAAVARPAEATGRAAPRRAVAAVVAAVVVVSAVAGVTAVVRGRSAARRAAAEAEAAPVVAAAPAPAAAAAAAAAPTPDAATTAAGAPAAAAATSGDLPAEELARIARPALVVLTCAGRLGSGFFVDRDRVLTNAHVTCGPGVPLEAKLADGRRLVARVRTQDDWLDFAVVEVPGANVAAPLALGDSTALAAGSPVVLVGSPLGLEATVHAGKVSFVGRNLEGVAHVQVNADVNPGNSGGPLLDARGRAVAVVTLKATGASGVGFALPIEYARAALDAPQPDDAAARRWTDTLARVAAEDDAEAARLLARLEQPLLVSAVASGDQLVAVFMRRWSGGPYAVPVILEVRDGAKVVCELSGSVGEWQPLEERFKAASDQDRASRTVRWMLRRKIAAGAYAGGAALDVSSCPEEASARAVVALKGTTAPDETAAYPAPELAAGKRDAQARARLAARIEEVDRAQAEGAWRSAFRQLRERIAKLEQDRQLLRDALDRRSDAALMDRARRELPSIEAELIRRRDELDDLERRASAAAIPREWRR